VTRARMGRVGVALGAASLLITGLFAGTAQAGETRTLTLNWSGNPQVTTGGQTVATLTITNSGGQNLSHVLVGIGTSPATAALPSTVTIVDAIGADFTNFCSKTSSTISCDFASMAAKGSSNSRSFQVIFSVSASGTLTVPTGASVNESGNPNGSNNQVFQQNLGLTVDAASCDLAATYFAPGQANKIIGDDTGCAVSSTNPQSTKIQVPDSVVSAVVVNEITNDAICQAGYSCFGQLSTGDVAVDGTYRVVWTIRWNVPSNFNVNKFGIIHFTDSGAFDFALPWKNSNLCKTDTATKCFVSTPTVVGTTLTAVFATAGNGGIKGFN